MPDREKVIEALDKLADEVNPWKESPPLRCDIPYPLLCDAIVLLKEQEPVKPTWSQGKACCGKCGHRLPRQMADREINYCGYCGQAVKWE